MLMQGIFGRSSGGCVCSFDRGTSSWKKSQGSLWTEDSDGLSPILLVPGTMRNGSIYPLRTLGLPTCEDDSLLWPTPRITGLDGGSNSRTAAKERGMWPTPTVNDSRNGANATANRSNPDSKHHDGVTLVDAVRMLPTPTANRRDGLQSHGVNVVSGSLNPSWVCWLMGFPLDWFDGVQSQKASRVSRKASPTE